VQKHQRRFGAMTQDLQELANWLRQHEIVLLDERLEDIGGERPELSQTVGVGHHTGHRSSSWIDSSSRSRSQHGAVSDSWTVSQLGLPCAQVITKAPANAWAVQHTKVVRGCVA
jgi:hypothetical protein